MREIDALSAYFYGLDKVQLEYILTTFETLNKSDMKKYGCCKTREMVLDIFDRITTAAKTGEKYISELTPPPGPPAEWPSRGEWPSHIHKV